MPYHSLADRGFLAPGQYLIHDRDGKFCPAFQHLIDEAGVTRVPLPARSPNLNAYVERWVRSSLPMKLSASWRQPRGFPLGLATEQAHQASLPNRPWRRIIHLAISNTGMTVKARARTIAQSMGGKL
jgi:transposase InsO family protein